MKRILFSCLAVWFFSAGVINGFAKSHETDLGPAVITMKSATARKIAEFPHQGHQEMYVCMQCHHVDGRKMTTQKCDTCHNMDMENQILNNYKKAGHRMCRECHKLAKKQGKAAPTNCSSCHPMQIQK